MIVVKKRVDLDFLGEEFKDSYLVFKAIAVKEFESLRVAIKKVGDDEEKTIPFITEQLTSRFLEGKVEGQDVKVEDLTEFSADVFLTCFAAITGQSDPKVLNS